MLAVTILLGLGNILLLALLFTANVKIERTQEEAREIAASHKACHKKTEAPIVSILTHKKGERDV